MHRLSELKSTQQLDVLYLGVSMVSSIDSNATSELMGLIRGTYLQVQGLQCAAVRLQAAL